jgi:hypothetical protein
VEDENDQPERCRPVPSKNSIQAVLEVVSVKPVLETQSIATHACPSNEKDLAVFCRRAALLAKRREAANFVGGYWSNKEHLLGAEPAQSLLARHQEQVDKAKLERFSDASFSEAVWRTVVMASLRRSLARLWRS